MSRRRTKNTSGRTIAQSLREYGRGVAGGLIFSLPLLYTMEVWWAGFIAHPYRLLAYVLATFILLLGYNRFAGLRRDASMAEVAIDSVEEMGLGLVLAALALWLLGRIHSGMAAGEVMGRVVIEAMTVAIGVSVGTAQLGGGEDEDGGMSGDGDARGAKGSAGDEEANFGAQIVIAFCGAVLFAANVAPTEEIVMIAVEVSVWRLLGLTALSLALGALVLYFSEFTGARSFVRGGGFTAVFVGSVITYAVALVSSALVLWFFGRFDGQALLTCLAQTIVLGVAGTLGASAGRLLLQ